MPEFWIKNAIKEFWIISDYLYHGYVHYESMSAIELDIWKRKYVLVPVSKWPVQLNSDISSTLNVVIIQLWLYFLN
jgi:hypothetical protein